MCLHNKNATRIQSSREQCIEQLISAGKTETQPFDLFRWLINASRLVNQCHIERTGTHASSQIAPLIFAN